MQFSFCKIDCWKLFSFFRCKRY